MTNQEFDAIRQEVRDHIKRTSFGAPDDPQDELAAWTHTGHAEYGEAEH